MKKEEERQLITQGIEIAEDTKREGAVLVVQKHFRGFQGREKVFKKREKEAIFLGFKNVKEASFKEVSYLKKELNNHDMKRNKLKLVQREFEEDYQLAMNEEKHILEMNEGLDLKQKMIDERREWMMQYLKDNNFAKLPKKIQEFDDASKVREPMTQEEQDDRKVKEDVKAKEAKAKKENKTKDKKTKLSEVYINNLARRILINASSSRTFRNRSRDRKEVFNLNFSIEIHTNTWGRSENENFEHRHEIDKVRETVRPMVQEKVKIL